MKSVLHPHQDEALALLRRSVAAGKRRPMVQAPTAFGKTVLAAAVIERARAKGNRVLFVVPAIELIDQTVEAFYEEGIRDIGVIQADHPMTNYGAPVQVASVQTLSRRGMPNADLAVIDEAHKWFKFYGEWFGWEDWASKPIIGLSATPWTKGLGRHYDELIVASTTKALIDAGFLSSFKVFAPSDADLTGVRTVAGDYSEKDLAAKADQKALVGDVVQGWLERAEGRPTLCFCVDRAHAANLQRQFGAAGVACGYVDCFTGRAERGELRRSFQSGRLQVVCNVGVLTTGVDWDVRCIIMARPTKSEILFVQIVGRGLRTAEGKDHCLILDHSTTTKTLGFVTEIHHDHLDDGARARQPQPKAAVPKACPSCAYLKAPGIWTCPNCGFAQTPQTKARYASNGALVEWDGKRKSAPAASRSDKAAWFAQVLWYTAAHSRSGNWWGWACHLYEAMFGCWPPPDFRRLEPREPKEGVVSFIRHQMIRNRYRRTEHARGIQ